MVMARDADASGQVDLAEVALKNISNVSVGSASLLTVVNYQSNINDSNGNLFLPSGVSASGVIGALGSAPLKELGVDPDGTGAGVASVPAVAAVTVGDLIQSLLYAAPVGPCGGLC